MRIIPPTETSASEPTLDRSREIIVFDEAVHELNAADYSSDRSVRVVAAEWIDNVADLAEHLEE